VCFQTETLTKCVATTAENMGYILKCGRLAGRAHCGRDLKCRITKEINDVMTDRQILLEIMSLTVPKLTGSQHWSCVPTANPIFVYFKFLTNLQLEVQLVVPITDQLSPGRLRFGISPNTFIGCAAHTEPISTAHSKSAPMTSKDGTVNWGHTQKKFSTGILVTTARLTRCLKQNTFILLNKWHCATEETLYLQIYRYMKIDLPSVHPSCNKSPR